MMVPWDDFRGLLSAAALGLSGAVPAPTGTVCAVIGPWHLAGKKGTGAVPVFAWA